MTRLCSWCGKAMFSDMDALQIHPLCADEIQRYLDIERQYMEDDYLV